MDLSVGGSFTQRLSWSGHKSHLTSSLAFLQTQGMMVDVSLMCGTVGGPENTVRCHKVLLAAASNYFQQLFQENKSKHAVVLLPHLSLQEVKDLVHYIYQGEVTVGQERLPTLLSAARNLQISGLSDQEEETLHPTEQHFHSRDEVTMLPQDLSMKSAAQKRRRLSEVPLSSPQPIPAHSQKPETVTVYPDSFQQHLLSSSLALLLQNPASRGASPCKKVGAELTGLLQSLVPGQLVGQNTSSPDPKRGAGTVDKGSKETKGEGSKVPPWSQSQLQEAIEAVITQKLRFTQASSRYGIPKGTLYDNILGKSKRMLVLEQVGLTEEQEEAVLEFCCEVSSMPYNRRTSRSLREVRDFVTKLKRDGETHGEGKELFNLSMRQGFKWWWAFTKKHSIISLYYENQESQDLPPSVKLEPSPSRTPRRQSTTPPGSLLGLVNEPSAVSINLPTSMPLYPFLGLHNQSKFSLKHTDFNPPPLAHSNVT